MPSHNRIELTVLAGTTGLRIPVFVEDSTKTDGTGKTGIAFNTIGLVGYYWRQDQADAGGTSITFANMTRGTWLSGGWVEKDSANMPGYYEFGVPDAAIASGASWVVFLFRGAPNMATTTISIKLVSADATTLPASTWGYATRTLTQSGSTIAAVVSGSDLTLQRGDTISFSVTGAGSLVGRTKLWWTAKRSETEADASALIKIEESAGLQIIAGATAATAANGTLTVTDAAAGNFTVTLAAVEAAKLPAVVNGTWDLQVKTASGVTTKLVGGLTVSADVTRET